MTQRLLAARTRRGVGRARGRGAREVVRVRLLGRFGVSVGPQAIEASRWRLRKAEGLVKLLALAQGHRLHREQVMDTLWPDLDAKSAANNLHRALHAARGALGAAGRYLPLRGDLLELCPDGRLWVDVEVFEEATATARRSRDPAAYRAALDLYAGDLLPGDLYEPWTEERRGIMRRLRLTLLSEMAALHEERGEYGPALEALERAAGEDPADETTHARLMRLYAANGRRHEALLRYGQLRKTLAEKLGAEPGSEIRRLNAQIRSGSLPAVRPPQVSGSAAPNNLPTPLTSFVGREREALEVKRALSMTRLMTLTGAGGTGKTRLALEVARDLVGAYPDGVWLVELAPLSEPDLAPRAVAAVLGVREQPDRSITQALCDHLASRQALLVLDNCEHLLDAAARVSKELLCACPRLRILATSREPLGVTGESILPVPTLSVPDAGIGASGRDLMSSGAVRLFVDRARSRLPAFELTPENADAVARICRELDGIPLAIELSTARMGALAVEQVAERLEDSLKLLTGGDRTAAPRHRTLRATLDWSYALLEPPERSLFERLSVFAGGFTLEAAEAVGSGDGMEENGVLELLSRLVDKSMVVVEAVGDGGMRYGMLEPVRRYGRERLESSGESPDVRRRHAAWYFELAREVEPWLGGARRQACLNRLEREYANLRSALGWTIETGETDQGLWFGGALAEFWYMSGHLAEARRWLDAALANGPDAPPTPARARALARAGWIAWEQGDYEGTAILSEESLKLSRELGDGKSTVVALCNLGWAALLGNDPETASALAGEAAALGRALGDTGGVARALLIPGLSAVVRGDHEQTLELHEESLALARTAGDSTAVVLSLVMGAFACLGRGDVLRAKMLCEKSFAASPRPSVANITAFQLHASAALACARGLPARSARLWGAAESLRESIGAAPAPVELRVYSPYIAAARAELDAAAWERAWAEGRAMAVDDAEEYARAESAGPRSGRQTLSSAPKNPPADARPGGALTRRQREVAILVARGLTNRRISSTLNISENTVANHVAAVIKKLGVESRSGIAAWATETRLQDAG